MDVVEGLTEHPTRVAILEDKRDQKGLDCWMRETRGPGHGRQNAPVVFSPRLKLMENGEKLQVGSRQAGSGSQRAKSVSTFFLALSTLMLKQRDYFPTLPPPNQMRRQALERRQASLYNGRYQCLCSLGFSEKFTVVLAIMKCSIWWSFSYILVLADNDSAGTA